MSSALAFGQAEFSFEHKTFKFPKTKEGELLKHSYPFTNSGNEPLVISDIKVSCSCTKFTFPKAPILPGEKGEINVTFDTKGKIAWQDRILEIHSNSKRSIDKIRFKVMVDNK